VIANFDYGPSVGRLSGPSRDAARLEASLRLVGFQVTRISNLGKDALKNEISRFAARLQRSGHDSVGFLYFAGHGAALRKRGENYLLPVDASLQTAAELPIQGVALSEVMDSIAASGAKAAIIVIDACRNVPFSDERGGRGLVVVDAPTDTLIAFATSPGFTASDNGLFASALADELVRPGATSTTVFDRVRRRVATQTNRAQIPRTDSGIIDPVVFTEGTP
jgi:uncharacterized caspase-like protein